MIVRLARQQPYSPRIRRSALKSCRPRARPSTSRNCFGWSRTELPTSATSTAATGNAGLSGAPLPSAVTSFSEYDTIDEKKGAGLVRPGSKPAAARVRRALDDLDQVRKAKEGEITTQPNAEVGRVRPKAMPVILTTTEEHDVWMAHLGTRPRRRSAHAGREAKDRRGRREGRLEAASIGFCTAPRNTWTSRSPADSESLPRANRPERARAEGFVPAGAVSMLMRKERQPSIRTVCGWAVNVLQEAGASANARSTAGCRIASTRMPASAPSTSHAGIRRPASLQTRRLRKSGTSWIRSAMSAPSARQILARWPERVDCPAPTVRGRVPARPWRAGSAPAGLLRR